MHLEHSFSVPVGIDEAWKILLDIERVAPCMPGAALDSVEGDEFTGTVKVKLGPINLTYKGKASFVEKDEAARRAVIDAHGRDARGNGTAAAKVTATLAESDGSTDVQVSTELEITGKPAQFGRGVMVDVGNKLIGQFADSLSSTLQAGGAAEPRAAAAANPVEAGAAANPVEAAPPPAKKARARSTRAATTAPAAESAPESAAEPASDKAAAAVDEAAPAVDDVAAGTQDASVATEVRAAVDEAPAGLNARAARTLPEPQPDVEPINLLEHAGPALAKRLAPVALAVLVLLIAIRRRRSRHA